MEKTAREQAEAFVESLDAAEDQADREGYVSAEDLRRRCGEAKAAGWADRIAKQSSRSTATSARRGRTQ